MARTIRERMLKLCGSIREDDGDPKEFRETKTDRKKRDDYRHQRLCRQVARTLTLVLPASLIAPNRDLEILQSDDLCALHVCLFKIISLFFRTPRFWT